MKKNAPQLISMRYVKRGQWKGWWEKQWKYPNGRTVIDHEICAGAATGNHPALKRLLKP
jgi:hypothetical protein